MKTLTEWKDCGDILPFEEIIENGRQLKVVVSNIRWDDRDGNRINDMELIIDTYQFWRVRDITKSEAYDIVYEAIEDEADATFDTASIEYFISINESN